MNDQDIFRPSLRRSNPYVVGLLVGIGVLSVVALLWWFRSPSLSYRLLVSEPPIRTSALWQPEPTLSIIATGQEAERFAEDVMQLDVHIPDQRMRLLEELHQIDYQRDVVVVVFCGLGTRACVIDDVVGNPAHIVVQASIPRQPPGGQTGDVPDSYQVIVIAKAGSAWDSDIAFELRTGWWQSVSLHHNMQ